MHPQVILTCAVTGHAPVHRKYPHQYPETPEQICGTVVEAAAAGATICHIHARDVATRMGSSDPALYREIVDRIRNTGVDIIINLTCGHGALFLPDPENEAVGLPESDIMGAEERVAHLNDCLPEIASLDICTLNQSEGDFDFVYLNTTRTLRAMAAHFKKLQVKPELEVFSPGDIVFARKMIEEGLITDPPLFQFVLGARWGAPADAETILYMRNMLPEGSHWSALGISRSQMPVVAMAATMGGNVRVGLEDNLYLSRGVFATNGKLVERARTILECLGASIASPAEARSMLGL